MDEEGRKRMQRFHAKVRQAEDQDLAQVRDEYRRMSKSERQKFKAWICGLAECGRCPDPVLGAVVVQLFGEDFESEKTVTVLPKTLKTAIDAWDETNA